MGPSRWSDPVRFGAALAFAALVLIALTLVAAVAVPLTPRRRLVRFGSRCIRGAAALLVRHLTWLGVLDIEAKELATLVGEGPMLLVPNHPSLLDAPILIAQLPEVCCVMKREVGRNLLTAGPARLGGYVDNGSARSMIRGAVLALQHGHQVLIFPEGTRTSRKPVADFTRAYGLIARTANVPMQTILIEIDNPYGSKGWPLLRRPPLPVRVRMRPGHRFAPQADLKLLVAQSRAYFERELGGHGGDGKLGGRGEFSGRGEVGGHRESSGHRASSDE